MTNLIICPEWRLGSKTEERMAKQQKDGRSILPCPLRTSAVTLTIRKEVSKSHAVMLATAMDKIAFAEVGINALRIRRIITGVVIL
jgi:hypothetical protein